MNISPTITFEVAKGKQLLLILLSLLFVLAGAFMISEGEEMGYVTVIFFGLSLIIAVLSIFPSGNYLKLTTKGFEVATLFRKNFTKWEDIKAIGVYDVATNKMIGIDYKKGSNKIGKFSRKLSKRMGVYQGGIPCNYKTKRAVIVETMEAWKNGNYILIK